MTEEGALFDLDAVFEVGDYMFVYGDDLGDERSDAEVASLVKLLALETPLRILDLACGFGRHANRLAALGHEVVGIDYMPGFLDLARQRAAAMGVEVDYRLGDMRALDLHGEFDLVLLLFTSFGYFGDGENEQVLRNAARALRPGGRLVFDMMNRDGFLKWLPPADVVEKGKDLVVNRFSFDVLTGRFHNRRIVIRDGVRKDKPFSVRLYTVTEMRAMLERIGLPDHAFYGKDGQPVSADSRRIVVVATIGDAGIKPPTL